MKKKTTAKASHEPQHQAPPSAADVEGLVEKVLDALQGATGMDAAATMTYLLGILAATSTTPETSMDTIRAMLEASFQLQMSDKPTPKREEMH